MVIVTGHRELGTGWLEVSAATEVATAAAKVATTTEVTTSAEVTATSKVTTASAEVTATASVVIETPTRPGIAAKVPGPRITNTRTRIPIAPPTSVSAIRGRGVAAEELVVHPHAGCGAEQAAQEAREKPAASPAAISRT